MVAVDEFGNEAVQQTRATLHANLKADFDWCAGRSLRIGYPLDRINAHRMIAAQLRVSLRVQIA